MKLYVVVRFMNHEADVEYHTVMTVTDVAVTDYHRNNAEVYVVMMPHVIGAHAVPPQQTIPI